MQRNSFVPIRVHWWLLSPICCEPGLEPGAGGGEPVDGREEGRPIVFTVERQETVARLPGHLRAYLPRAASTIVYNLHRRREQNPPSLSLCPKTPVHLIEKDGKPLVQGADLLQSLTP